MQDVIEFWLDDKMFERIHSSVSIRVDTLISIKKKTYHIKRVSYAIDTDKRDSGDLRQNVELERVK